MLLNKFLLFPILIGIKLLSLNAFASEMNYGPLKTVDKHLEQIEDYLRDENMPKACIEAKTAAKIIKLNISNLKKIEPYYNWEEIRNVLLELPRAYCVEK